MNRIAIFIFACIALIASAACSKPKPAEPVREYKIDGEILKVDPAEQSATIKHKAIEGWMGAMTMDYPIRNKEEMSKLHPGDHITGTVYVQGEEYSVGNIQSTPAK